MQPLGSLREAQGVTQGAVCEVVQDLVNDVITTIETWLAERQYGKVPPKVPARQVYADIHTNLKLPY